MHIFHTTSWLRDQISQEILIVIFLCLPKIYLWSFTWSKLHFKTQEETVSIISWIFRISAILLRTSQVNNVMGLEAALAWDTCTVGLTRKLPRLDGSFTKNYWALLRSLEALLFQMNRDNGENSIDLILVGKCPQIIGKKRNNTVNESYCWFGTRGYSIRGIHLPIVLLT